MGSEDLLFAYPRLVPDGRNSDERGLFRHADLFCGSSSVPSVCRLNWLLLCKSRNIFMSALLRFQMATNLVSRSILQETCVMYSAEDEILVFLAFD